MINLLLVMLGGALGAASRFGLVLLIRPHAPGFPAGTLACNLLGCAAIGLLAGLMGVSGSEYDRARLFLFTGLLGGFTTFSSFGLETIGLCRDGRFGAALAYIALSNTLGLAMVYLGWRLAAPAHQA